MRFALGVLVLGVGCKGILGIESGVLGGDAPPGSDAPLADAPEDALVDTPPPDAHMCFGTFQQICLTQLPDNDLAFTGPVLLDTFLGCDEQTTIGGVEVCIRSARQITVASGAQFAAIGTRFLVLVATEEIRISGTLDSWSAGSTTCTTNQGGFSSGGAGGSFGTVGGKGGGAAGSLAKPAATATTFRRGCPGDEGGTDQQGGDGGIGGSGIFLVAPSIHLTSTARINASGYGGGAGNNDRGGGGGGSGGFILLDSSTLMIESGAVLLAVGGGGGGGGGGGMGIPGTRASTNTLAGLGGAGNAPASGDGGDGGIDEAGMPGETGNNLRGSGGGGGGTGVILVTATAPMLGGTLRPMPITP